LAVNEFVVLDVNCNVSRWFFVKKTGTCIHYSRF